MELIFGSEALKYWFPLDNIIPKDIDIISKKNKKNINGIEYHWANAFEYILKNNKDKKYVDMNFLYTIKVSHASWDINWVKTMKDIEFLTSKGAILDLVLFNLLYKDWELIHSKKKVKMDVHNKDFFKKNITRKYNHEELHEIVSFYKRPLNEKIREDINSPLCSEYLWDKLSKEDKIKCTLEEIFVLTMERHIFIDKPIPIKQARIKTIKQMITSSTSGWFCRFIIENFKELRITREDYLIEKIKIIKKENI